MTVDDKRPLLIHARELGIDIPTLCHDDRLTPYATCNLCVVEIENTRGLVTACTRCPEEGMVIETENERILASRQHALKLLFSDHYANCVPPCRIKKTPNKFISRRSDFSSTQDTLPLCVKEAAPGHSEISGARLFEAPADDCKMCQCSAMGSCEIRKLAIKLQVLPEEHPGGFHAFEFQELNPRLGLDMNKCIRCAKCIRACDEIERVGILGFVHRGFDTELYYMAHPPEKQAQCMDCCLSGATCVEVCPTGALENLAKNTSAEGASPGG